MEQTNLHSRTGILRALEYLSKDLERSKLYMENAILYLSIIEDHTKNYEKLVPLPYWYYGLPNYEAYLRFFTRFNLIFKMGNSVSISEELVTTSQDYLIQDFQIISKLDRLSTEIIEIKPYLTTV